MREELKTRLETAFLRKIHISDVPINIRFNVEAHTSILAARFYTLWAECRRSPGTASSEYLEMKNRVVHTKNCAKPTLESTVYRLLMLEKR